MPGFANDAANNSIMFSDNVDFSGVHPQTRQITTNGQLFIGSTVAPNIRTGTLTSLDSSLVVTNGAGTIDLKAGATTATTYTSDSGTATPSSNNLNVFSLGESTTTASGSTVNVIAQRTAKFIVDPTQYNGTNQTIQSAINSASSGDDIFIRANANPYIENLTMKPGVSLVAFGGDSLNPSVNIQGKITFTQAGTCSINNIQLTTNSDFCVAVTGSAASILNLNNCNLNCTNNTGITYTSSSASSKININSCKGNLGTTGIGLFANSSAGTMSILMSDFTNSGASTTSSTSSAGSLILQRCYFFSPITTSSTASISGSYYIIDSSAQNTTAITCGGSGASSAGTSVFSSGTASAVSVGAGATYVVTNTILSTSNANAVAGAGSFNNSSNYYPVNTALGSTTLNWAFPLGIPKNTAPTAGTVGEQIRSAVASGSAVSLVSATGKTITSISLTPGIWDVSCLCTFSIAGGVATVTNASISTTNNTLLGILGDSVASSNSVPVSGVTDNSLVVPAYRISLSATTTIYMVGQMTFTVAGSAYGRISATRVA